MQYIFFFEIQPSEQKLILSCGTKMGVQTDIGFDLFDIYIDTNNLDKSEPLGFSLMINTSIY